MEIRIFGLADDSIVDGPGVRYTRKEINSWSFAI